MVPQLLRKCAWFTRAFMINTRCHCQPTIQVRSCLSWTSAAADPASHYPNFCRRNSAPREQNTINEIALSHHSKGTANDLCRPVSLSDILQAPSKSTRPSTSRQYGSRKRLVLAPTQLRQRSKRMVCWTYNAQTLSERRSHEKMESLLTP